MREPSEADETPDEPDEPPVPPAVAERLRARRHAAVKVLRVLCALPALLLLYHAVFPKVNYTHRLTLTAPGAAREEALGPVRLERRDRALALVAVDGKGRDRAGPPKVVVRNTVRSAATYHRIMQLQPGALRLTLGLPAAPAGDLVQPRDNWRSEVVTSSDYRVQLGRRLYGLALGLLLVALAALLIPRLVYVLWPDRGT